MSCGTPLSDWQRRVIAAWHQHHPNPTVLEYGPHKVRFVPRGVWCATCKTPAVLFPANDLHARQNKGYCVCPKCSLPKQAEAA